MRMIMMLLLKYLSYLPSQEWVSKWKNTKAARSRELEAKGTPKVGLPFNSLPGCLFQTKTTAGLAMPKPFSLHQPWRQQHGWDQQTILVWPKRIWLQSSYGLPPLCAMIRLVSNIAPPAARSLHSQPPSTRMSAGSLKHWFECPIQEACCLKTMGGHGCLSSAGHLSLHSPCPPSFTRTLL